MNELINSVDGCNNLSLSQKIEMILYIVKRKLKFDKVE